MHPYHCAFTASLEPLLSARLAAIFQNHQPAEMFFWRINPGHWAQFFFDTVSHFQRNIWPKEETRLSRPAQERCLRPPRLSDDCTKVVPPKRRFRPSPGWEFSAVIYRARRRHGAAGPETTLKKEAVTGHSRSRAQTRVGQT